MEKLSTLHLSIPEFHTDPFAKVFNDANLCMPAVKTVVLATFNDFVIKHCPNVTTVLTNGWRFLHPERGEYGEAATRMIDSASKAEKLSFFEMNQFWSASQVEGQYIRRTECTFGLTSFA
jgi:hypothetical protein